MAINRDKVLEGAMKLLSSGKYDKAIVEFQKLVADDPKDVRTLVKIAETLHVKMGKRKEALDTYDRAAQIYTDQGFFLKAIAVYKQMLAVDATSPDLHLKLAELYQQMGHASQSLHHYQQVVVLYEQQGRGRDVVDVLKRMVELDPENLQSRVKVAELSYQQGMVNDAVTEMRQAFEYLKNQERYDDAVRAGEKVCAWDASALDVAKDLGTIYLKRGEAKAALGKLQVCFQYAPRDVEILGLIAQAFRSLDQIAKTVSVYKEMARIYDGDGNHAEGRGYWERVLELVPGDDDAEIALGRRQATAVGSIGAVGAAPAAPAPRANPEDEQLARLLTETDVYVKYGLRDKAIDHLNKIFELRPDYIPGLEKLRQLQSKTNQKAAAADTLKRLIEVGTAQNHPKVGEWQAEFAKAPAAPAPAARRPAPAPKHGLSSEGEVILVEEDAMLDAGDMPNTLTVEPKRSPNMLASMPSSLPTPSRQPPPSYRAPPTSMRGAVPRSPALDEPLDEPLEEQLLGDEPLDELVTDRLHGRTLANTGNAMVLDELASDELGPDEELAPPGADEFSLEPDLTAPMPAAGPPPSSDFGGDDMGMLDALAAQAVQEALPAQARDLGDAPLLALSDDDVGALEAFAREASMEGEPIDSLDPLPDVPDASAPVDDEFDSERTVAYGSADWQRQIAQATSAPASNSAATLPNSDDSMLETGELPAAAADLAGDVGDSTNLIVPPHFTAGTGEALGGIDSPTNGHSLVSGIATDEFDPNAFDLPDDVKAMLAAPMPDGAHAEMEPMATNAFDEPSLASIDADDIEELGESFVESFVPPPVGPPPASVDDVPEGMSQSRALFAPERGFEDDPANTFFPDELAEAEFFIQQDLLDEAREILEPILDEIDDSERVKHMLARITAKENDEPEPPPPWANKLIEDVGEFAEPARELSDPGQVSVEEVLSQFKKGIAETVPEDDAATHYDLGIAYREMGLLDDAVGEFEVAARAASKTADAQYLIGLVRLDQGRVDDALSAFATAVSAPQASQAQQAAAEYQRGVVLCERGDEQQGFAALTRSKTLGGSAPDLDRRLQALEKKNLDDPSLRRSEGRPKNVDYV